jgi:hypothetical protein
VLLMPALQVCNPVTLFVLMEANDLSFQNPTSPLEVLSSELLLSG